VLAKGHIAIYNAYSDIHNRRQKTGKIRKFPQIAPKNGHLSRFDMKKVIKKAFLQ
jgi:hypothetical protein